MVLFLLGFVEMIIISAWTKLVSEAKVFASGAVTVVNILIWYYVLRTVIDDIANWRLIIGYTLGCALGTMATTAAFRLRERAAERAADAESAPVAASAVVAE